jgi:hypothetical protein
MCSEPCIMPCAPVFSCFVQSPFRWLDLGLKFVFRLEIIFIYGVIGFCFSCFVIRCAPNSVSHISAG